MRQRYVCITIRLLWCKYRSEYPSTQQSLWRFVKPLKGRPLAAAQQKSSSSKHIAGRAAVLSYWLVGTVKSPPQLFVPPRAAHTEQAQNARPPCTIRRVLFFFFLFILREHMQKKSGGTHGARFCTSGLMLLSSLFVSKHHCCKADETKQATVSP